MNITGKHLVNGQWTESAGDTFHAVDPSSGKALSGSFSNATQDLIDQAFAAAETAFDQLKWPPFEHVPSLLDAIVKQLTNVRDELIARAQQETALPAVPRLQGEFMRMCAPLKLFAQVVREGSWVEAIIDTAIPDQTPMPRPDVRRMLHPIGPVVVFGASNFPLACSACGVDVAAALASGNSVLVKGHPLHPGTSEIIADAIRAALEQTGLPAGMFSLLQGNEHAVSEYMVRHPSAQAVGFTGSKVAGRHLYNVAASRDSPVPVFAEMGSVNPMIMLPGMLEHHMDRTVEGICGSVLFGGGQLCTKPGIIMTTDQDAATNLANALWDRLSNAPDVTLLGSKIQQSYIDSIQQMCSQSAATLIGGGQSSGYANASPAVLLANGRDLIRSPILRSEVFGPATIVVHCSGVDELVEALHALGGSLTGTVHFDESDDIQTVRQIRDALRSIAGRILFAGYPTGVEVCHATIHGGPYPATTIPGSTSIGTSAMKRFTRAIAYQDAPEFALPHALPSDNPQGIMRLVNGHHSRDAL